MSTRTPLDEMADTVRGTRTVAPKTIGYRMPGAYTGMPWTFAGIVAWTATVAGALLCLVVLVSLVLTMANGLGGVRGVGRFIGSYATGGLLGHVLVFAFGALVAAVGQLLLLAQRRLFLSQ